MSRSDRSVFLAATVAILLAALAGGLSRLSAQSASPDRRADSLGRRRIQPLPALGSAPETGLQFGATVLAVWEPPMQQHARPASLVVSALRTAKAQTRIRLDGERWSANNDRRVAGSLQWQQFPLPYYGIGDRTPKAAEETFTPRGTEGTLAFQQRISGAWYTSAGVRYLDQRIGTDTGGTLRARTVTGSTGGRITEWSAGILTDTRDNLFAPRTGQWVQATYARSARGLLSDYSYGTTRLDARMYRAIGGEHVIATQLQIVGVDGAAPFDQLALIGNGDIMRGYARGRYRDRWMTAAQTEYRSPIRYRVGGVAFAGVGISSPSIGALENRRLLPTYGVGLRVQIDPQQRTGVRADYGRGRDGASGLYIGFNQAF
jgi:Omp85 superfamily domain